MQMQNRFSTKKRKEEEKGFFFLGSKSCLSRTSRFRIINQRLKRTTTVSRKLAATQPSLLIRKREPNASASSVQTSFTCGCTR